VSEPTPLSPDELLTLAALCRAVMRLDGAVTPAEVRALDAIRLRVAERKEDQSSPYRDSAKPEPITAEDWRALLSRAERELADEARMQAAARSVERPEAREAIFICLAELAAADAMTPAEMNALGWLEAEWDLALSPER
jgi:uncharacterized tellurite resistance protein B-like protein